MWGALWWGNGQIRDPSNDEIGAPWWPNGEIWDPRPKILFKEFDTAPLHSFKLMGLKFQLRNFRFHTSRKRIHGALNLHCSYYISKIVWWLPMFDFGIFCHLLRLMGIYRVGPPSGYLKSFVLSFLCFLSFSFSFLFFMFFFPLSRGPLQLWGPWTLSTYATQSLRHCPCDNILKVLLTKIA